ncbi:hypothetical protein Leryth_023424 [Lithospermum erythrorhizon]|nr:hypothetical protein Leryth_023424 [Lithospermum erythrorhizon]
MRLGSKVAEKMDPVKGPENMVSRGDSGLELEIGSGKLEVKARTDLVANRVELTGRNKLVDSSSNRNSSTRKHCWKDCGLFGDEYELTCYGMSKRCC